jgi:hypothetical protein
MKVRKRKNKKRRKFEEKKSDYRPVRGILLKGDKRMNEFVSDHQEDD